MNLRVDPASKVPASEQLRVQIARAIERGRLLPGERLPSVRDLATELGVAANTVARAYRALEAAGFLVGRGRRGTFVADALPQRPSDTEARLADAARAYARRARQLGADAGEALRAARRVLAKWSGP